MENQQIMDLFQYCGIPHCEYNHMGLKPNAFALYRQFHNELIRYAEKELGIGEHVKLDVGRLEKLDLFEYMASILGVISVHAPFSEEQAELILNLKYPLVTMAKDIAGMPCCEQEDCLLGLRSFATAMEGYSAGEKLSIKVELELDHYYERLVQQTPEHILKTAGLYAMLCQAAQAIYNDVDRGAEWSRDDAFMSRLLKTPNLIHRIVQNWENEPTSLDEELISAMCRFAGCEDQKAKESLHTRIEYSYTDADNYKTHKHCVVKGLLSHQDQRIILSCRHEDEFFIPSQVGLDSDLPWDYDHQSDHPWWRIDEGSFSYVNEKPTTDLSAEKLVRKFQKAKDNWDEMGWLAAQN